MSESPALSSGVLAFGTPIPAAAVLGADSYLGCEIAGYGRRGATLSATQRSDGRRVAIKAGRQLAGDRQKAGFFEQAAALQRLNGLPHLVPVLDFGVGPEGVPWLAEPWLEGISLDKGLTSRNLAVSEVVELGRAAAGSLAALHASGLLHANLTPGAMLRDAHGEWWIDGPAMHQLGAAPVDRCSGAELFHLPPEVLEGSPWSAPGDVWALGSCLYTALTGSPPWGRRIAMGRAEAVMAMASGGPDDPIRPDLPAWLLDLIRSCLSIDPASRPSTGFIVATVERHSPSEPRTVVPNQPPLQAEGRPLGSSYLLDEPIGSGASGQVWRGRRRWDDATVAVKLLRPELAGDPDAVARFLRERSTLVGLDHPNLVPVLDLVAEGETMAIVMVLVDGPDLRKVLRNQGYMAPEPAAHLMAQVAEGLAYVHTAGIVHRDLKPENVLIQDPSTSSEKARVTDFGIARSLTSPSVTRADQLMGTAGYLAPELVIGREASPASDVYSLGVMLYELAAGRRPFDADNPGALLRAHLEVEPARPDAISPAMWQVVSALLAKDPVRRPDAGTCAGLLRDLSLGRPVVMPPAPPASFPAGAASPAVAGVGVPVPAPPATPASAAVAGVPAPAALPGRTDGSGYGGGGDPGAELPTTASARPLASAPEAEEAGDPRRWPRRRWVLAGVAAVVVAATAGILVAVLRGPGSPPTLYVGQDVTLGVTATPAGAVTIRWANATGFPRFSYYVISADGRVTSGAAGSTSETIDGVTPGSHCYRVDAVFHKPIPPGLPAPDPSKECVDIP